MSLRDEFEKLKISPDGLHPDAKSCAAAWNRETSTDERLARMIDLAEQWLLCCKPSKSVNKTAPSSFGLAKICSRWHGGARVLSGCLLMAASRLGYQMEAQPPMFIEKIGRNDANAWISITSWPRDGSVRPGTFTKQQEKYKSWA
jgi:hypothetical protein